MGGKTRIVLATILVLAVPASAAEPLRVSNPRIVEVSVPTDSSDGPSWSSNQNVWTETLLSG